MRGGLGAAKAADQEVQEICDRFKVEVEQKSGANFNTFQAVEYKTQLVAGTNYYPQAHVGGDQYVHLRIYKKLPCYHEETSLTAFQLGKTRQDDIVHFEPGH
ncbi:PREDICTED: cystatin-B-like [Nanorana parkeri]|uniref:cystatin-B-like n=1 Tax=Nanorana parkeri TaxID=125878 RepID=UPI0008541130|nr:PREDICTED: cystatin-B-like [Nanorana parkeri]